MRPLARSTRRLTRWLPAIAWMTVIFLLSSQSGLRVSEDAAVDRPIRIVAHLATYALLAGFLLWALSGRHAPSGRAVLSALLLTLLYALSDELHQALVPGRTGRLDDVVVDMVGGVVGVVVAAILQSRSDRIASGDELEHRPLDAERQHS